MKKMASIGITGCILFCSCSGFNGNIEKGDVCTVKYEKLTENASWQELHNSFDGTHKYETVNGNRYFIKNTSKHHKLKFTVKEKSEYIGYDFKDGICIFTKRSGGESYKPYILEPGEKKEIDCSVSVISCCGYYETNYEVVGEQEVKE